MPFGKGTMHLLGLILPAFEYIYSQNIWCYISLDVERTRSRHFTSLWIHFYQPSFIHKFAHKRSRYFLYAVFKIWFIVSILLKCVIKNVCIYEIIFLARFRPQVWQILVSYSLPLQCCWLQERRILEGLFYAIHTLKRKALECKCYDIYLCSQVENMVTVYELVCFGEKEANAVSRTLYRITKLGITQNRCIDLLPSLGPLRVSK